MATSPSRLKGTIRDLWDQYEPLPKLDDSGTAHVDQTAASRDALCKAIAEAVLDEITGHGEVTEVPFQVATTGGPTSQAGTATQVNLGTIS